MKLSRSVWGGRYIMLTLFVLVLVLVLPVGVAGQVKPVEDIVTIDGTKNPELIPEWSAWALAFRFISSAGEAMGDEGVPTGLYRVLTKVQRTGLQNEVYAAVKGQKDCEARVIKLQDQIGTEKFEVLLAKTHDISMECRRATLQVRNRLLSDLPPDGQVALRQFVESQKIGTVITVRRSDLAAFRLPE